jgi:hypothetical protein
MRVESTLKQIVAGATTAPAGPVHVVGREVLVSAIQEIERLRTELEIEKLENAGKRVVVTAPMPGRI